MSLPWYNRAALAGGSRLGGKRLRGGFALAYNDVATSVKGEDELAALGARLMASGTFLASLASEQRSYLTGVGARGARVRSLINHIATKYNISVQLAERARNIALGLQYTIDSLKSMLLGIHRTRGARANRTQVMNMIRTYRGIYRDSPPVAEAARYIRKALKQPNATERAYILDRTIPYTRSSAVGSMAPYRMFNMQPNVLAAARARLAAARARRAAARAAVAAPVIPGPPVAFPAIPPSPDLESGDEEADDEEILLGSLPGKRIRFEED